MSAYWFIRTKTTEDPFVPTVAYNSQERFNRDVSNAFSGLTGGYGNAGDLLYRATSSAIPFFILCDGAALSRTDYSDLYEAISTLWGAGDGATTFNIPTQAQLATVVATPPATPPQTVTENTVTSGTTVTTPTTPAQTGGTSGGAVDSGGRVRQFERNGLQ